MLKGQELDQFLDEFLDAGSTPVVREEKDGHDLEEYTLPSDGLIIRQMKKDGKVSRRTWLAIVLLLLVVPVLLYISVKIFHGRKYLLCSLILVVAAMLPFFMMFEGRKPKAREIMVISVLAAIGVAGRAAFFMLPSFKPVAAIVILTGVSFGGEAGFLVGCMIMLLSNMFMGQGPWTPWQMFAFGLIGFLAGILYRVGIFDLWRNHEPGRCTDVLWIYNERKPDRKLYFRRAGRSGPCSIYCDFFMGFKQTASRKTGKDQT